MWSITNETGFKNLLKKYYKLWPYIDDIVLHQSQNQIFLPRYLAENYPSENVNMVKDNTWKPQVSKQFKFIGKLHDSQTTLMTPILKLINSQEDQLGILKGRPGSGKTVMGIYLAAQTQKPTLVIVDNSNLIKQWQESVLKFTDLNENNIGLIQGKTFYANKDTPIILCMVQTLISKVKRDINNFYSKIQNLGIDLVLADECHKTTTGPKYAKASLFLNTKNILGLSATPFLDELHKLMMDNTIGPIIAEDKQYEFVPKVFFVKYDSGLSRAYSKRIAYGSDLIKQRAMYNKIIIESPEYFRIICDLVKSLLKENHRVIIIAFTTNQVRQISETLTTNDIENTQFYSQKRSLDKMHDKVIIATYQFASHGFDMKRLSSIILASPLSGKKSLIQCIGRILRDDKDKNQPVVYDLIDTGFNGMFLRDIPKKRNILKNEFNCEVKEIQM